MKKSKAASFFEREVPEEIQKKVEKEMEKIDYQQQLVEKLEEGELEYSDASIYTVLLSLVSGSDIGEVFMLLHNVSSDLGQREKLEGMFDRALEWDWN